MTVKLSIMQSVAVRSFTKDIGAFELLDLPIPETTTPDDILIKVHAAAVNPVDLGIASGITRLMQTLPMPYSIGMDFAGIVHGLGTAVTSLKVGDRVFGFTTGGGSLSEYLLLTSKPNCTHAVAKIPEPVSFVQAASLPCVGLTGLIACARADAVIPGGLRDKTVFIPAGLSGTGSVGVQIAKNVYGAAQVITTVSTPKVALLPKFVGEGTVDRVIDYTKEDINKVIQPKSVDFVFDTTNINLPHLHLIKPNTGFLLGITTPPSGRRVKHDFPELPGTVERLLNAIDWFWTWRAARWKVKYEAIHVIPKQEDLESLMSWAVEGKLKTVVGRTANLEDIDGIRAGLREIMAHKGGVGKFVVLVE